MGSRIRGDRGIGGRSRATLLAFLLTTGLLASVMWTSGPAQAATPLARISAGNAHTCAVTTAGGAVCWGINYLGALGDGSNVSRPFPVPVQGLSSGVADIDAGNSSTCAVTTEGGATCWGSNASGQLGDGTLENKTAPVPVSGLASGVAAISVGSAHACALSTSGGATCWGFNLFGGLGDGSNTRKTTPVDVSGLVSGVASVSAGGLHTCAVTNAGAALCWGWNSSGQLGDGTLDNRTVPTAVTGLGSDVATIAGGDEHTCALTTTGGVLCWGRNDHGELGDGTTTDSHTPVPVSGLSSGVAEISAGGSHTCALTTEGAILCWGRNLTGQIGDGTTTDRLTPVEVTGVASPTGAVAAGGAHTCALGPTHVAACWGFNLEGQLGNGTEDDSDLPLAVVWPPVPQAVAFEAPASVRFGRVKLPLAPLASTLASSPVTFASETPDVCRVVNKVNLRFDDAGTCEVTASSAGDDLYLANSTTAQIQVEPALVNVKRFRIAPTRAKAGVARSLRVVLRRPSPRARADLAGTVTIRDAQDQVVATLTVPAGSTGRQVRVRGMLETTGIGPLTTVLLTATYDGNDSYMGNLVGAARYSTKRT